MKLSKYKQLLIPLLLLFCMAPFASSIDLAASDFFFDFNKGHFDQNGFYQAVYIYALIPGWVVAIGSLIGLFIHKLKRYRRAFLYLILVLAMGSGVIVHWGLKEHWARPRPRQIERYGGDQPFMPFYQPREVEHPKQFQSFPCGHCSMGFYFFSFYFLGVHFRKRWLSLFGLIFGLAWGILLSYVRIAQGGHFFSDTFVAAIIMWLTAYFLGLLLLRNYREGTDQKTV